MVRSMYSGVSGLRVHQTKMDVIGNNIANVNTTGFKSSMAIIEDIFSQNSSAATAPAEDGNIGGTGAKQIGLGAAIAAINIKTKAGSPMSTERSLDVALTGDGYFALADQSGRTVYTRSGNFDIDLNGDLVHAGTGYYVLAADGAKINIDLENYSNIEIDKLGNVMALDADGVITNLTEGNPIQVANFPNNGSLEKLGNSMYQQSANSGEPLSFGEGLIAGQNGTDLLAPGYLEMSNVDLATEFTEMITTQRGYQANSRVITVSDTMLEELINLKR